MDLWLARWRATSPDEEEEPRSGWRPPSNGCGAPPFAIHKLLLERGSYPHTGRRELQLPIPHETGAPAPPTIRRRPPAKGAPDSSAPPAGWPDGPQPLLFGSTVAPKGPTADSHRVKGEEGYSPGTAIHEGQKAGMGPRAPHWMRNRPPPWGRGPTLAGRVALAGSMASRGCPMADRQMASQLLRPLREEPGAHQPMRSKPWLR